MTKTNYSAAAGDGGQCSMGLTREQAFRRAQEIADQTGEAAGVVNHDDGEEWTVETSGADWAVLDISGEQRYGRIISRHATKEEAQEALDAEADRQTEGMRDVLVHLMWTVEEVEGNVGERVRYR